MRVSAAWPVFARSHREHALVSTAERSAETLWEPRPEAWLRNSAVAVPSMVRPLFYTFEQVREDLATHTAGLTREQVWRRLGNASVGFHLQHLAGSVDRLTTYLLGRPLTPQQLEVLKHEGNGTEDLPQLLNHIAVRFQECEQKLLTLSPDALYEPRAVGRQALPTTVIGLIVHIAEHTQRHLGQVITLSQVLHQPDPRQ